MGSIYTLLYSASKRQNQALLIYELLRFLLNRFSDIKNEYRETRSGDAIPLDDARRLNVPENFIEVLEIKELDTGLISALQSILDMNESEDIV